MRFLLALVLVLVAVYTEETEDECSRFSPHELRATVFDPLMMKKVKFLRTTLEAAIDGLEELEQKTMDVPESMKEKLGLNVGEDEENDTTGEMRSFLLDQLDSIIRKVSTLVSNTYQSHLHRHYTDSQRNKIKRSGLGLIYNCNLPSNRDSIRCNCTIYQITIVQR